MPAVELVAVLRSAGCVFAEEEAAILLEAAGTASHLADMLALRTHGYPLEHIVGWAQFYGLRISVAPGVFVPRLRSEFLVSQALAVVPWRPPENESLRILDLCCGSGAVGAALSHELIRRGGQVELHAADIDPAAVACATANIAMVHGVAYCGDLFAALPESLRGRMDVIVANAPYVPSNAIAFMPVEARIHEPDAALNGGVDGLEMHRRIAAEAPRWLRTGGTLLLESSARQARESQRILSTHGFDVSWDRQEESDATVVMGRLVAAFSPGER